MSGDIVIGGHTCRKIDGEWHEVVMGVALRTLPLERLMLAEIERLRALVADYENSICWETTCINCAKLLDANYDQHCEIERLRAERDAIGALHQPVSNPYDSEPNSLCGHCLHQWPCQTHRLLHPEEARRER